jgi:hypothetical protein
MSVHDVQHCSSTGKFAGSRAGEARPGSPFYNDVQDTTCARQGRSSHGRDTHHCVLQAAQLGAGWREQEQEACTVLQNVQLAGKTLDNWWKEMQMMYTHLCKRTQLYKWLELGRLVRQCLNLQYQAVLTTHNAFRKTVKWLSKVQPLVKAFAQMIPADLRLNWGPYDLHTDSVYCHANAVQFDRGNGQAAHVRARGAD